VRSTDVSIKRVHDDEGVWDEIRAALQACASTDSSRATMSVRGEVLLRFRAGAGSSWSIGCYGDLVVVSSRYCCYGRMPALGRRRGWVLVVVAALLVAVASGMSRSLPATIAAMLVAAAGMVTGVLSQRGVKALSDDAEFSRHAAHELFADHRGRVPRVRDVTDPVVIGVHRAAASKTGNADRVPPFVRRDCSAELEKVVTRGGCWGVDGRKVPGRVRSDPKVPAGPPVPYPDKSCCCAHTARSSSAGTPMRGVVGRSGAVFGCRWINGASAGQVAWGQQKACRGVSDDARS
jgi:hypothetical protein